MNKKIKLTVFFLFAIFLAAARAGAEEGFQKTSDGINVFYDRHQVENAKGSVILVHGWGVNHKEWSELVPFLNQNGWTTVAIDIRGHGASTQRDGNEILAGGMSTQDRNNAFRDIEAVKSLVAESREVWIAGSSFGAAAAFKCARENPWIHGLILISPGIHYYGNAYITEMEHYGKRPIFFAASKKDKLSFETSKKLKSKAEGKSKFKKFKGDVHGAGGLLHSEPKLKRKILKWINRR